MKQITASVIFLFIGLRGILSAQHCADTFRIGLLYNDYEAIPGIKAAEMAVSESNKRNPGTFIKLETRSMQGPWGAGSKQAVDLIFNTGVKLLVISADGRNAHLAEQVAAKSKTTIINIWSGDPTLSRAFVPWYFSLMPDYDCQAALLMSAIPGNDKGKIAVVSGKTYDEELACGSIFKRFQLSDMDRPALYSYANDTAGLYGIAGEIAVSYASCVIFLGKAETACHLNKLLIQRGYRTTIILASALQSGRYPSHESMNGIIVPYPASENREKGFIGRFMLKNGFEPGPAAMYAYDCLKLVVEAVKMSRGDATKLEYYIKNTVYKGITGNIGFDTRGNNTGKLNFIRISDEQIISHGQIN